MNAPSVHECKLLADTAGTKKHDNQHTFLNMLKRIVSRPSRATRDSFMISSCKCIARVIHSGAIIAICNVPYCTNVFLVATPNIDSPCATALFAIEKYDDFSWTSVDGARRDAETILSIGVSVKPRSVTQLCIHCCSLVGNPRKQLRGQVARDERQHKMNPGIFVG